MKSWWQGLVPRERFLIGVAGGLTTLVICFQFILVPALNARAAAKDNLQAATERLNVLQEAYQLKRLSDKQRPQTMNALSAEAFKAAVTQSATDKGLSISRLQNAGETSVSIVFDNSDPRLVFFWLNDVETRLGGQVERMSVEQSGGGQVRVNVDLEAPAS